MAKLRTSEVNGDDYEYDNSRGKNGYEYNKV